MALTVTTLSGAVTATATQIKLTAFTNPSTGPISAPTVVQLDGQEQCLVSDASLTPSLSVVRGWNGTQATPHGTLGNVTYGLTSDFTSPSGTGAASTFSYGADATITNPTVDAVIYINKGSAAALTLTDPNKDQTNTVKFVSTTAYAHLITYATGFYGNTTTSDVATFPATVGGVLTVRAINGVWFAQATADDGVLIG